MNTRRTLRHAFPSIALAILVLAPADSARGGVMILDLTTAGATGSINSAIYAQGAIQPAGTGRLDSFVRIQMNGSEEGYNTTDYPADFDNFGTTNYNRSILLGDVPKIELSGQFYREFALDINENSGNGNLLSIDEIQLFVGGTANLNVSSFNNNGELDHDGSLVYRMDSGMDSWVALDYSLGSGSGESDMLLYVPESNFTGFLASDVVTLYSKFGEVGSFSGVGAPAGNYSSTSGFEEWFLSDKTGGGPGPDPGPGPGPNVVPEPASFALWGLGTVGILYSRRLRRFNSR